MPAANPLKQFLKRQFPGAWQVTAQAWRDYHARKREARLARITGAFVREHGWRVMGGPFQGMLYGDTAVCSALLPKLAGSYEAELQPLLESLSPRRYDTILDVGCAEGYYAVGFALRWPHTQVRAYDTNPQARELCAQMAEANGVAARVKVEGACDAALLRKVAGAKTLLVCDCEGCELELLQPGSVPELRDCDMLVELHDCLGLVVRSVLYERFAATHTITIVDSLPRRPDAYPALACLSPSDRLTALDEIRPPMQWGFFRARTASPIPE